MVYDHRVETHLTGVPAPAYPSVLFKELPLSYLSQNNLAFPRGISKLRSCLLARNSVLETILGTARCVNGAILGSSDLLNCPVATLAHFDCTLDDREA